MKTENNSNKKACIFAFSIVFLIAISPYVGSIPKLAALALFFMSFFFLEKIDIYIILFAIFPFANIFKMSPMSMSFLTICEMGLFAFTLFDFGNKRVNVKFPFIFSMLLFLLYLIIGSFLKTSISSSVKILVRCFVLYYFFNADYSFEKKRSATIGIAMMLSVSMILMMGLSLNVSFIDRSVDYLRVVQIQSGFEQLTRNGGLLGDPNYCSLAILMTISLVGVLYYSRQIGNVYWLLAVPLIVMGFTTYSKSFFICIILYAILMIVFVLFPKHPWWGIVTIVVLSIVVAAAFDSRIAAIERILERFRDGDLTTGRTGLNQIYLTYLFENPIKLLFGSGFASQAIPGYIKVHNLYIESLYRLGIVGSSIYLSVIRSCLYTKGSKRKKIAYLPALFMLAMYLALAGIDSLEFTYYILICGIAVKYASEEEKEQLQGEIQH